MIEYLSIIYTEKSYSLLKYINHFVNKKRKKILDFLSLEVIQAFLIYCAQVIQLSVVLVIVHTITHYEHVWDDKAHVVCEKVMLEVFAVLLVEHHAEFK